MGTYAAFDTKPQDPYDGFETPVYAPAGAMAARITRRQVNFPEPDLWLVLGQALRMTSVRGRPSASYEWVQDPYPNSVAVDFPCIEGYVPHHGPRGHAILPPTRPTMLQIV